MKDPYGTERDGNGRELGVPRSHSDPQGEVMNKLVPVAWMVKGSHSGDAIVIELFRQSLDADGFARGYGGIAIPLYEAAPHDRNEVLVQRCNSLHAALWEFHQAFTNRNETTNLAVWNERLKEANKIALEQLGPNPPVFSLLRPAVTADARNATPDQLRRGADILVSLREPPTRDALKQPAAQEHDTETEQRWPNAETPAQEHDSCPVEGGSPVRAAAPIDEVIYNSSLDSVTAWNAAPTLTDAQAIEIEQLAEAESAPAQAERERIEKEYGSLSPEMMAHLRKPAAATETTRTFDASTWAKSFNETLVKLGYQPHDEGWLIGWFANAIMCGYDEANLTAATQSTREAVEDAISVSKEHTHKWGESVPAAAEWKKTPVIDAAALPGKSAEQSIADQPTTDSRVMLTAREIQEIVSSETRPLLKAVGEQALAAIDLQANVEQLNHAPGPTGDWPVHMPENLHLATQSLVACFASAMADKLYAAQLKYKHSDGWQKSDWMGECRKALREHIEKGDPIDAANYCAFLWYHGESTKPIAERAEAEVERLQKSHDELILIAAKDRGMMIAYRERALLAEAEVKRLTHDVHAYRGALGYAVPGSHDGKLSDGTTPKCGFCDGVKKRAEAHSLTKEQIKDIAKEHFPGDLRAGDRLCCSNAIREAFALAEASSITEEQLRGAIARGWCDLANSYKVMDTTLAESILREVSALAGVTVKGVKHG